MTPTARGRLESALPWLALGFAFSPVLVDLARAVGSERYGGSLLLAAGLAGFAAARETRPARPGGPGGVALVIAGLALEALGLSGGSDSIARLGLPVSILGLALRDGRPAPATALLALWVVPLPTFVHELASPAAESALAGLAARSAAALGLDAVARGPIVEAGAGGSLRLSSGHGGLHLAAVLAELGWYAGARRGRDPARCAVRAALAATLAALGQPLAVLGAVALLATCGPDWASLWLDHGLWIAVTAAGVGGIEWRLARAGPGHGSTR